jgi:spermidine/putrescine transport system substrate-binding protein
MSSEISRRRFIGRAGSLALASSIVAGCGGVKGSAAPKATATAAVHHARTDFTAFTYSNWPLYIDRKVILDFDRRYHAKLRYLEDINDYEEFFAKVRQQLQRGKPIGRDLVTVGGWMAARWIRLGYLDKTDRANTPNVTANLVPELRSASFDPKRSYTTPWQGGITGIGFNRKAVGDLKSLDALFDPRFKGKVTMLSDAHDCTSLVMLAQGVKPADAKLDDVMAAIDKIDQARRSGQVRRFTGNDYTTDLTKGNVDIAMAYAADLIQLKADNPHLDFVVPDEGAILWSDDMGIPRGAEQPYGAEVWMNYVYEPEIAARITNYVAAISPVAGVQDLVDRKLAENSLVFPDEATRKRLVSTVDLSPADERQMNERFAAATGS